MPAWHQSHIRTRLKQTYFTSASRVRRVGGSRDVRGVLVGGVVTYQQSPTRHRCHPLSAAAVRALCCGWQHGETASRYIHRTAFHGIRKLPKLLEKTYDQRPWPCFSRSHYTSWSHALLVGGGTRRATTVAHCIQLKRFAAFLGVPVFSGPAFSAPPSC